MAGLTRLGGGHGPRRRGSESQDDAPPPEKVLRLQVLVTDCTFSGPAERAAWHFRMIGHAVTAADCHVRAARPRAASV